MSCGEDQAAFDERAVEQIVVVEVEHVEEERRERQVVRRGVVPAEPAHRVLESTGERVVGQTDRFAVEHERTRR